MQRPIPKNGENVEINDIFKPCFFIKKNKFNKLTMLHAQAMPRNTK